MNTLQLQKLAEEFAEKLKTDPVYQEHVGDHRRRSQRVQTLLTPERASGLTEDELRDLFFDTDAFSFWSNKEWEFNNRLQKVGLDGLRQVLLELVQRSERGLTSDDVAFLFNQKGLGMLLTTELLAYRRPEQHWTYNETVTLQALRNLGEDVKANMPRGQKSNAFMYLTVKPLLEQIAQALKSAGLVDVNYMMVDIFLWHVKETVEPDSLTTTVLANILRQGKRSAETRKLTTEFLQRVSTLVMEQLGGHLDADVGIRTRSDERSVGYQYLDRAYFYLEPKENNKDTYLSLALVFQMDGNLFWGFQHWSSFEGASQVKNMLEQSNIMSHDEQIFIGRGAMGTDSFSGGAHIALGHKLTANELEETRIEQITIQIAGNLADQYWRLQPQVEAIRYALLSAAPQSSNVWLLQAVPAQYDLDIALQEYRYDDWRFSRYQNEVRPGDILVMWKGGSQRGIYGLAQVVSGIHPRPAGDKAVDIEYTGRLKQPLLATTLQEHPVLSKMHIMRQAQGTNFRVTPEEWAALQPLLGEIIAMSPNGKDVRRGHQQTLRELLPFLQSGFHAKGLHFTPWQIAAFYTALQTKGFVILSGISGTGKTKLAQSFAHMLPQPVEKLQETGDQIRIVVQPYMIKYNRVIVPKYTARFFDPPQPGNYQEVTIQFNGQRETCRLVHAAYEGKTDYISLMLRGKVGVWFKQTFQEGDALILEPELDKDNNLTGFRAFNSAQPDSKSAKTTTKTGENWLFVSVRPDWRDSKSLLGYYNPLTGTYEWTPFLRFLQRAVQSFQTGDGLAWFVIFDEMNLARVEYYFADLLSVLESGRDENGWTREPLRFIYPEDASDDLPPAQLRLPPNLYIIGTVNMDETTHAFSPKVLDRAFTLELRQVDFSNYLFGPPIEFNATAEQQLILLGDFTRQGTFAQIEKGTLAVFLGEHAQCRQHLQTLNQLLQPYDLHFGYRVFDEIIAFADAAQRSRVFESLGGVETAFDAAVQMKILPKFYGARNKLESPLLDVLAWCITPETPASQVIRDVVDSDGADGSDRRAEPIDLPLSPNRQSGHPHAVGALYDRVCSVWIGKNMRKNQQGLPILDASLLNLIFEHVYGGNWMQSPTQKPVSLLSFSAIFNATTTITALFN